MGFTPDLGDQLVIEYEVFVSLLRELLSVGISPFHAGAGATAGAVQVDVRNPFGNDGDTVVEIIPLDILDKYDSLLPEGRTELDTTDFGDQFVVAYDFLLVSLAPLLSLPGIVPPHVGAGEAGGLAEGCVTLLVPAVF